MYVSEQEALCCDTPALVSLCQGWGRQRKPPGVAMGKSLQHFRETWNFLLLTISYPAATLELTGAGQTPAVVSQKPLGQ